MWANGAYAHCFQTWARLSEQGISQIEQLRTAFARYALQAEYAALSRWQTLTAEKLAQRRALHRSGHFWKGTLEVKVMIAWARVLPMREERRRLAAKSIIKLMHRQLALCWQALVGFLHERRELRSAAQALAFRHMNGELTGAFVEWKAVWAETIAIYGLSETVQAQLAEVCSRLLAARLYEWHVYSYRMSLLRFAMGKQGRKELAEGFYRLRRHRSYCRLITALSNSEAATLRAAVEYWAAAARLRRMLELMHGTNVARDSARRLRRWHRITAKRGACDLRRRYVVARRTFYQRQEILTHWRMQAAALQHARRLSMMVGLKQLLSNARGRMHMRRCGVRALGLFVTTLSHRVLRGWRLHAEMAKNARIEIVRARANQTALESHRRRARARALATIVYSWRVYAEGKADVRRLANAQANATRVRTGFSSWRLRAAMASKSSVVEAMALTHFGASSLRVIFEMWHMQAAMASKHSGVLSTMYERRAGSTQRRVFGGWLGLVLRSKRLIHLSAKVCGRLMQMVLRAWHFVAADGSRLEGIVRVLAAESRQATLKLSLLRWRDHGRGSAFRNSRAAESIGRRMRGAMHGAFVKWVDRCSGAAIRKSGVAESMARRMRGAASAALDTLARNARIRIVGGVIGERTSSRVVHQALHAWRRILLVARKQMKQASAHAFAGLRWSTFAKWKALLLQRRTRREVLLEKVGERTFARDKMLLGELVRMWRAVTVYTRHELASTAAAFSTLRAISVASSGTRARLNSAFAYYCKRLAGLIFFHWRALSWSRNWEKPGRLAEDGYDLSDSFFNGGGEHSAAERSIGARHSRVAASLVKGAVVHQRRSTLSFQQSAAEQKDRQAEVSSP